MFTVTLTSGGAYTLTLNAPVDHPVNSVEDAIAIDLGGRVQVVDADGPAADNPAVLNDVSVTVIDDVPVAEANARTVAEGTIQSVDVQFIVDMSGSMFSGAVAGVPTFSDDRAGLARYAMLTLLQSNEQIQNVQFIAFGDSAAGSVWMDRDDAIAYVNSGAPWSSRGGTNYDLALSTAMTSYAGTRVLPEGDQTFVYFLSDGEPLNGAIDGDGTGANVSIAEWESHITHERHRPGFAFGIGAAPVSALNPSPIRRSIRRERRSSTRNVILVSTANVGDLAIDTLPGPARLDLVRERQHPARRSEHAARGADSFGADGGRILSITVDGVTYEYLPGSNQIDPSSGREHRGQHADRRRPALGGTLTFYFVTVRSQCGRFVVLSHWQARHGEHRVSCCVDGDGDQTGSTLNLTVTPVNEAPSGTNNTVVATEDTAFTFTAAHFGFTDPNDTPADALAGSQDHHAGNGGRPRAQRCRRHRRTGHQQGRYRCRPADVHRRA